MRVRPCNQLNLILRMEKTDTQWIAPIINYISWHHGIRRSKYIGEESWALLPATLPPCFPAFAIKIRREKAAAKCNFVRYKISPILLWASLAYALVYGDLVGVMVMAYTKQCRKVATRKVPRRVKAKWLKHFGLVLACAETPKVNGPNFSPKAQIIYTLWFIHLKFWGEALQGGRHKEAELWGTRT